MQSKENSSLKNESIPTPDKNPWQKMADEVLADNCKQQGSVSDSNNEHETSSETTEEDNTIVAEKTGDKDIRFPDIEVDWNNRSDFWDKYDIMQKWLANVVNEDGSWKYDNVAIPKEWQKYVDQQLEGRKRMYEERKEKRRKAIEWIKTSKNIDISFEKEYWEYSHDSTDDEAKKRYSELSDEHKEAIRHNKDKVITTINSFLEKTNSMKRIDGLRELAGKPLMAFISKYQDGTITDSTIGIVTEHIYKIVSDASGDFPDDGGIRVDYDEYTKDDEEFSRTIARGAEKLSTAIKVADFSKDVQIINTYMDVVVNYPQLREYAEHHPIDNRRVAAYIKNVAPLVDNKNSEVKRLWDDSNNHYGFTRGGSFKGDRFGTGDFCIHALTSEINPTNIQELLLALRDASSDNYAAYEQNRNDAYELEGTVIDSRRFIHGEEPGEHEILASMLRFYDTKDSKDEHIKAENELRAIQKKYDGEGYCYGIGERMFDLSNYEQEDEQRKINGSPTGRKEKVIEALRRLVENTDPNLLEKPKVEDTQLNDLIQNMYLDLNKQSGETYVEFDEVGKIVKQMNELLKERQGKTGIKPSEIKVIAFVERVATFAMRGISKKDRSELPFDSDFKEMCRFAELTSQSNKYDEADFENFWNRFSRIKNFEDEAELMSHYQMLSSRRLAQLRNLPEKTPFLKKNADALWSGNLNDELLRLVDEK